MCRRAIIEKELASRVYHTVLRWFGHMERMDDIYGQKGVMQQEVEAGMG